MLWLWLASYSYGRWSNSHHISCSLKIHIVYSNYNRATADSYDGGHIDIYGDGFDGCSDASFSDGTFSS